MDPFQTLRDMIRFDPLAEQGRVPHVRPLTFAPPFEVRETKDGYLFKADLPGVKEQDLEVSFTGSRLTISGSRMAEKRDESDTYYSYERSYGSFMRAFTLPEGADLEHVRAELKDGVLTINIPKVPTVQPKKVTIKTEKVKA
jgi:HSP20 family protein